MRTKCLILLLYVLQEQKFLKLTRFYSIIWFIPSLFSFLGGGGELNGASRLGDTFNSC